MPHAIDIARLRHRLVLEAPVDTPDGAGGVSRMWQAEAELWGALEPVSASARLVAEQQGARVTHRIVLRHRPGITTAHRLSRGGRTFAIRSIYDPDERGRALVIAAEEDTP